MDFSKLTLHQAKRFEMETQVRVLELESELEKERRSLGELRKTHYRLAAESEGWDQEVTSIKFYPFYCLVVIHGFVVCCAVLKCLLLTLLFKLVTTAIVSCFPI